MRSGWCECCDWGGVGCWPSLMSFRLGSFHGAVGLSVSYNLFTFTFTVASIPSGHLPLSLSCHSATHRHPSQYRQTHAGSASLEVSSIRRGSMVHSLSLWSSHTYPLTSCIDDHPIPPYSNISSALPLHSRASLLNLCSHSISLHPSLSTSNERLTPPLPHRKSNPLAPSALSSPAGCAMGAMVANGSPPAFTGDPPGPPGAAYVGEAPGGGG